MFTLTMFTLRWRCRGTAEVLMFYVHMYVPMRRPQRVARGARVTVRTYPASPKHMVDSAYVEPGLFHIAKCGLFHSVCSHIEFRRIRLVGLQRCRKSTPIKYILPS